MIKKGYVTYSEWEAARKSGKMVTKVVYNHTGNKGGLAAS